MMYLIIGLIFYAMLSLIRQHTFKNANFDQIMAGFFLCVLLWPLCMMFIAYEAMNERVR